MFSVRNAVEEEKIKTIKWWVVIATHLVALPGPSFLKPPPPLLFSSTPLESLLFSLQFW